MILVQTFLKQKLVELQEKNPRLSNRYFAKKLGISSGALSEILQGKRKVSKKMAVRFAENLHLDSSETADLCGQLPSENTSDFEFIQMRDDQFHMIADWPHFAILNLVKSERCVHRPSWFARQLNLPLKVVHQTLDRLIRLEFLSYRNKKYVRLATNFQTSDDILNLSIRKSNIEDLEMIKEQLTALKVEERDLTSLTMLIDPQKMPEFKKWIRRMQDQFAHKFETAKSVSPFRLTVALFPLRKP